MKTLLMSLFLLTPRSTIRELPKEIDEIKVIVEKHEEALSEKDKMIQQLTERIEKLEKLIK